MDGRRARAVLGVAEHATHDEIRRAFRARALATHPDRGGDRSEFELAVLAFEALRSAGADHARRSAADAEPQRPRYRPFCAYDTPGATRRRPTRTFDDVLRVAMARAAHAAA